MADMTTRPEDHLRDAREVNRRQTTASPNGISGQVGECVDDADVRLVFDAVEPQANSADEGSEEGLGTRKCPPVDGAELLADLERFAGRFLAFPTKHHLVVLCLWATHTWAVSAFYVTPRLVLDSPEPGSGKTRVLEVLALLSHDAKLTLSTTTAALYRRIKSAGDNPPTILQDECDAVFGRTNHPQAEDLRALFNAGYKTGATVDRCERHEGNMAVVDFPVFAPVAMAGLISGPVAQHMRTVLDRAVVFCMRRRAPDEHVDEFRGREAEAEAAPLRKRLRAWADDHFDALAATRPRMPAGVRDRRAECWEALLSVAEAAGGDWPERAREACCHFEFVADADDERLSLGMRMLRDIEAVFGTRDRMHSADIVDALISDSEFDWGHLSAKPLDQRRLAKELKRYGVAPDDVRIGDVVRKGYIVDGETGLGQAWCRWLSHAGEHDKGNIAAAASAECSGQDVGRNERYANATSELSPGHELHRNVADVADVADTGGDLGPLDDANFEQCSPAVGSESMDEFFPRLRHKLLADLNVHQHQTIGSSKRCEPERDDGEPKNECPQCHMPLGPNTRKCWRCIASAKNAAAHEHRPPSI
jgi:hypothetical protein